MDILKIERLAREILAEIGSGQHDRIETRPAQAAPTVKHERPLGGDGWQRGLCTFWNSETKDTMKGPALRGRLGLSWLENGTKTSAFYPVFDAGICEQLNGSLDKGQAIKVRLKPWKDTQCVIDVILEDRA
jgi:hypothetical protein